MTLPLEAIYETVVTLECWVRQRHQLPADLVPFASSVLVCSTDRVTPDVRDVHAGCTLPQVMEEIHRANVLATRTVEQGWRKRNVFSTGRVLHGDQLIMEQANPTTAQVLQSREWNRVFTILGPSLIFWLFTEWSLFYRLANDCFHQLCGVGAQNLPTRSSGTPVTHGPVDVRFDRSSMFYKQRLATKKVGLPSDHPLCQPASETAGSHDCAINLLHSVFPRTFGHASIFGTVEEEETLQPKLLRRRALPLVTLMLKRSQAVPFRPDLNRSCPSRMPHHDLTMEEKEAIICLATQEPYASHATLAATQAAARFSLSPVPRDHQPCILDFGCHPYQVSRFLQQAVSKIVPPQFFGSTDNETHVLTFIDIFVRARRLDVLTLQAVTEGFRVTDCQWLYPLGRDGRPARVSRRDAISRTKIAHEFLFWVISGLVMPLLRFNFFITESSATRNQLHYFRYDDWQAICEPLLAQLKVKLYEKQESTTLPSDSLGCSTVRLLPKERGMRPIANLGWRPPAGEGSRRLPSVNDKLREARTILQFEQKKQPAILGASLFTPNAIVRPLLELKDRLSGHLGKKQLFFVKVDIRKCFDTIRQDRLLAVLREVIPPDTQYRLSRRYDICYRSGRLFRDFHARSVLDQEYETLFTDDVLELASVARHKIFVDSGGCSIITAQELFDLLSRLISKTRYQIGSDFYRQKEGIPQGSCVSTILCSIFYGHFERHSLGHLLHSKNNLMLRLLDDFLFVSSEESSAESFLRCILQKGMPYGAEIAREKSTVNFDLPSWPLYQGIVRIPSTADFAWCGFTIDQYLDVRIDFERQQTMHMADTLTATTGRNPGKYFNARLHTLARSPMTRVVLSTRLNSLHSVCISIYQVYYSLAMRMYAFAQVKLSAKRGALLWSRHRLLLQAAQRLLTARDGGLVLPRRVDKRQALFLGLSAFERAWGLKGRDGRILLGELSKIVKFRRYWKQYWRERSASVLAAPSNAILHSIRF